MPQQLQLFAFCFIAVALSLVATLVGLNEKGKVMELFTFVVLFCFGVFFGGGLQWFKMNVSQLSFWLVDAPSFHRGADRTAYVQDMYRAVSRTPQTAVGSGVGGAAAERLQTSAVDVKG